MEYITKLNHIVTISIGSGKFSDIQFIFANDLLGTNKSRIPKHAKVYNYKIKYYIVFKVYLYNIKIL